MKLKRVIMSNGNEYVLVWDEDREDVEGFLNMIDTNDGWVKLNPQFISEVMSQGVLRRGEVSPKSRALIIEQYGEEVLTEEDEMKRVI